MRNQIKNDTLIMVLSAIGLTVVGAVDSFVSHPQFHHGVMIGVGATLPLVALWRQRALLGRLEGE